MSYIVPGDIPSDCTKCKWGMCNYPTVYCRLMHKGSDMLMAIKSRPDWCPLIEVPTPHGRLADLDKMINDFWDCDSMIIGNYELEKIKTVIEAED